MSETNEYKGSIEQAAAQEINVPTLTKTTFLRIPSPNYLELCLGIPLPDDTLDEDRQDYYLTFTQAHNMDYLQKAQTAKQYLNNNIENAVQSSTLFSLMLETYTRESTYESKASRKIPNKLNTELKRQVTIPGAINAYLILLAHRLRGDEQTRKSYEVIPALKYFHPRKRDIVLSSLNTRMENIRNCAAETLRIRDLRTAIYTLYRLEQLWLWDRGNHSRSMNFFNVLLEKIGYNPISHGIIDFAAFAMDDFEDFHRYVKFVMSDVEGQDLRRSHMSKREESA